MKLKLLIIIIAAFVFLALPGKSFAVNICWDGGGTDNNWNTANNWDGDTAPGSGDVAVFDSTTCTSGSPNKDATINVAIDVQGINITNYTGTITQGNGNDITLGSSGYNQNDSDSTFTGGDGTSDITIDNSTGDFTLSAGTFTAPAGITEVYGDWSINGGTFNDNSGTVRIFTQDGSTSTVTGSATYNNFTIRGNPCCNGTTFEVASSTTVTVNGTLTLDGDGGDARKGTEGPGEIHAKGDITILQDGWKAQDEVNPLTIVINGTSDQTITGTTTFTDGTEGRMPFVKVNKSSGNLSIANEVRITGDFTHTAGTYSGSTGTLIFWPMDGESRNISGSPTIDTNAEIYFSNCCNGTNLTLTSGSTLTIGGNLSISEDTSSTSDKNINGPGTINVQGNATKTNDVCGDNSSCDANFTMSGSGDNTLSVSGSGWLEGTHTIDKSGGGSVTLSTNLSINDTGQDLVLSNGTFDTGGFDITVNDVISMNTGSTFKLTNDETISYGSTNFTGGTVEYTGSGTYSSLTFGSDYYNVTFSGSGSFSPGTNLDVDGNYSQSAGTFNVAPSGMNIGGNLSVSGGTYDTGSSTVTFDSGLTSVISGGVTFYNLTSVTAGKTIQFTAGETFTVSNDITLRGEKSSLLTLESTSQGTQWNIDVEGSDTLSYLSVEDSNACGGSTSPLTATGSSDAGNNDCWDITGIFTGWYNRDWTKRRAITIDSSKVAADHTDFPVYISLDSDTSLSNNAQADGDDILFTSDDGTTKLSHEIESYSSGTLDAWVKISSLSSSSDTTIYMYYGNSSASNQEDVANVWNTNYKMVQHLQETSGTHVDSTSNNNDSTTVSVTTQGSATGQIDGADEWVDSNNDYVEVGDSDELDITGSITISAWIKGDAWGTGSDEDRITLKGSGSHSGNLYTFEVADGNARLVLHGDGCGSVCAVGTTDLQTGTWYYVTGTYDGSNIKLYVNATEENSASYTGTGSSNADSVALGGRTDGSDTFDGIIDESRISNTAHSANWILTEYNNQSAPSSFYTLGDVATAPQAQIRGGTNINGGTNIGQ